MSHTRLKLPGGAHEHRRARMRTRLHRLLRSSAVGIVATGSDFVLLETCVRALRWAPGIAKLPALILGSIIQFVGVRNFAFGAREQKLGRQVRWYLFVELVSIVLTFIAFRTLVHHAHVPFEVANFSAGAMVYFGFTYPMFHKVFKKGAAAVEPPAADNVIPIATRRTAPATPT